MGARPIDDLQVGLDQGIELLLQRLDLGGELALQTLRLAGADRREVVRIACNGQSPNRTWNNVATTRPSPSTPSAAISIMRNSARSMSISAHGFQVPLLVIDRVTLLEPA